MVGVAARSTAFLISMRVEKLAFDLKLYSKVSPYDAN